MNEDYNDRGFTSDRLEDEEMFSKHVVGEDTDLMLVDCLLREAFCK